MTWPLLLRLAHTNHFAEGKFYAEIAVPANHDDQGTNCRSTRGNCDAAGTQRRKSFQNSRLSKCRPLDRSFWREFFRSAKSGDAGKDPRNRESYRGENQRTGNHWRAQVS